MIPFEEAIETVLARSLPVREEWADPSEALFRILAESVATDIPMPPFDRSAVDGYALPGEGDDFGLVAEITASPGTPPPLMPGCAAPIMTGAQLPEGADRVVMLEDTFVEAGRLRLKAASRAGRHICYRGEDLPAGHEVLGRGVLLTPAALGVAAMAGRVGLKVARRPLVALITTGNEVTEPSNVPGPGEIRNANGVLGASVLAAAGFGPIRTSHSVDSPGEIEAAVNRFRDADVLLIAGGVSMGTHDFVPSVMKGLGFRFLFEEVAQKPGKPLCFAVGNGRVFFGLPGNPVSVLVALETYVVPFLRKSSGFARYRNTVYEGRLECDVRKKPGRTEFLRAVAARGGDGFILNVPETHGSGDLRSATAANCLIVMPADSEGAGRGGIVPFTFLSGAHVNGL